MRTGHFSPATAEDAPKNPAATPVERKDKGSVARHEKFLAQTKKDFDELALPLGPATGSSYQTDPDKKLRYTKVQTVEGRLTRTVYVIPEGRSTLEVVRNYTNELEAKGARTLFQCSKAKCGEDFHKLHGVPRAPTGIAA